MICVEISGVDYKTNLGILIEVSMIILTRKIDLQLNWVAKDMPFCLFQVPYALGEMLIGLIAYFEQDWRIFQQILSGIVMTLILLWILMPESPRWLLSQKGLKNAISVLKTGINNILCTYTQISNLFTIYYLGAKINRKSLPKELLKLENNNNNVRNARETNFSNENISVENSLFLQERIVEENEQLGLKSLFDRWYMAKISLIMFYNWMAATIGYYGLGMFSVHLAGDIYVNFVLSALIEIPSYIFCVLVN